jgi:hypothetical protein
MLQAQDPVLPFRRVKSVLLVVIIGRAHLGVVVGVASEEGSRC